MRQRVPVVLLLISLLAAPGIAQRPPGDTIRTDVVTVSVEPQHEAVKPGDKSSLAVHFELAKDWHFYASAKTAPGGMNLKLKPASDQDYITFSDPLFPPALDYFDKSSNMQLEVFGDKFTVFLPFSVEMILLEANEPLEVGVKIGIEGAVCSDILCRMPDFDRLSTTVRIVPFPDAQASAPRFILPQVTPPVSPRPSSTDAQWTSYSLWAALGLALLAGLSLNIMPCVWPVLPLIVMRIIEQAKQSRGRSIAMGLVFCLGILLFFACLAAANIILQVFYGTVLQWGDQFRNPVFVAAMALLLVVLALFMFGLFTITVPSSIASKSGSGKGYTGAVGMGFLAAILSTPCSFGILAAAFAWAQGQRLALGTLAIMVIGVGMAAPYAVLTSMPALLGRMPKAGRWMEIFKQAVGFVLLFIAIWLIAVLPPGRRTNVLYFALVLGFCVWMWGGWVSYNTKALRKVVVRLAAVALALLAGLALLPQHTASKGQIDWQPYDAGLIETAKAQDRPVLMKFTADWCLSCKVVERTVYGDKEIAELLHDKNVLAIKGDTTVKDYPATLALKNIYKEPGVPVSMLFLPGRPEPLRWRGKSFAGELKELLQQLPQE
ncbi:MAG: protein-disulfide reductase DsbD family protein [Planctomycetota bacterium]|jgi:thiol:disulfide interchange protein